MNKLSVIITTKNNAETIEECINRVLEAPPKNKEVIVVYGTSNDGTEGILFNRFQDKVKLLLNDVSPGSAINTGVLNSFGEIIFFIEGHSYISPEIFTKTLETIKQNKKIGYIIFSPYIPPNFNGNKCQKMINLIRKRSKTMGQFRAFRRKTFFNVNGFWVYPFGADDLEFATKVYGKGWEIKVLTTKSWDISRKSFVSFFKYQLYKVGFSEYLWYEVYRNHPYPFHEHSQKGRFLRNQSLIVLYNKFLRHFFLSPFYAIKVALEEKDYTFIPFYICTKACYILGFLYAGIFHRKEQKWMKKDDLKL